MKTTIKWLCIAAYVIVGIIFIIWFVKEKEVTPEVERDKSIVIYDGESYARTHRVFSVDATSEYVFLDHGKDGIISVYDWEGSYRFSIVTTRKGNGAPEAFCCGESITVFDKNKHAFTYKGERLMEDQPFTSLEEYKDLWSELVANRNHMVSLNGTDVVDRTGRIILTVYDSENTYSKWGFALTSLLIVGLFCFFIAYKYKR